MTSWVFTFWLIKTGGNILLCMMILLGTLLATWIFTFVWTTKMVEPFAEASKFEKSLHVLVNSFVTIPYGDSSDEAEIFCHFPFRSFVNVMMVVFGCIVWVQTSGHPKPARVVLITFNSFSSICFLCPLLGGLFMYMHVSLLQKESLGEK